MNVIDKLRQAAYDKKSVTLTHAEALQLLAGLDQIKQPFRQSQREYVHPLSSRYLVIKRH